MFRSSSRFLRPITTKLKNRFYSTASNMASESPAISQSAKSQKFDYLLIIDFEATCKNGFQIFPQEIIEFPCMKMNTATWETESIFHRYVRPVANPILTSFCTELTGIVQDMVDGQPTLEETLKLFDDWLRSEGLLPASDRVSIDQGSITSDSGQKSIYSSSEHHLPTWAIVTCGDWDLKSMLRSQCEHFGYPRPAYFGRWINVKKIFFKQFKIFPKGMMQMMDHLNLQHQGRHHSGIDDATNIAQIVRSLGLRGAFFDVTRIDQ